MGRLLCPIRIVRWFAGLCCLLYYQFFICIRQRKKRGWSGGSVLFVGDAGIRMSYWGHNKKGIENLQPISMPLLLCYSLFRNFGLETERLRTVHQFDFDVFFIYPGLCRLGYIRYDV